MVAKALGAEVFWDEATKTISFRDKIWMSSN